MIEQLILQALQTAGIAAIATTAQAGLPIKAFMRTGPSNPANGRYWEFVNITNNRSGDYWDDSRVYQGNFRIMLHWGIDDKGAYEPLAVMDVLARSFKKAPSFAAGQRTVKIYDIPDATYMENSSELLFVLTLPYRCFAPAAAA